MSTKRFHLGDVLSVTTGLLVSPSHIAGVHELLDWMTGDTLFTHQLPRANDECQPALLAQFPELAEADVPSEFAEPVEDTVPAWLAEQVARFGEYRDVAPLNPGDHTRINPLAEMAMNFPNAKVIPVVIEGSTDERR